jgi:amino-acid N-acetyltransferase
MAIDVQRAVASDAESIARLLRASELPEAGVFDRLASTLVARDEERVVGTAALEIYGEQALLRSVAVASDQQGLGVGKTLTEAALQLGKNIGIRQVYLLTTTAVAYFPRFGFMPIDRNAVPAPVQQSVEFHGACPASAVAMTRSLA